MMMCICPFPTLYACCFSLESVVLEPAEGGGGSEACYLVSWGISRKESTNWMILGCRKSFMIST